MPQDERLRVWKNELKKTSGGLTRNMLMKNKRGKIVSKKKSEAAKKSNENNLGSWLRAKGDKFGGEPQGLKAEDKKEQKEPKVVADAKKFAAKKVANEVKKIKKEVAKQIKVEKKVANAKKVAPPKLKKLPKKKVANAPPKRLKMEPMKAGEKYEPGKVSVGNIIVVSKEQKKLKEWQETYDYVKKKGWSKKKILKYMDAPPPGAKF